MAGCLDSICMYLSEAQGREFRAGDENLEISTSVVVKAARGSCRAWREEVAKVELR